MGSSLLQWESDPLFSAAEVVQDSADRMESIFRLLLHEQNLVEANNYDPKLLTLIGYHSRDLATILETAKWQLEDFERAVISSARMDRSQSREAVIFRHKELLNEQDKDNLAFFLSGGINNHCYELGDSDIFKRFLDPPAASCSSDAGIVGNECGEIEEVNMNGNAYSSHYYDSLEESNLRKVDSQNSMKLGLNAVNSFQESSCNRNADDGSWYIEAGDSKPKCFFHENKLRGSSSSMNLIGFFNNLWGRRVPSSYTKRLKDGEEEHSPLDMMLLMLHRYGQHIGLCSALRDHGLQGLHWFLTKVMHLRRRLGACNARFDRFSYLVKVNQQSIKMILAIVFVFTLLGKCTIFAAQITCSAPIAS
ncbi:hypothetical protein ES319_D04G115300v1 [Gossypium barbadense]|uniref:Syntaxin 6/10/61 N-terminal domain-containing protein n=2 Tax=Gossypium TaxID=3633 RepID=A0A5J5RV46_GOSBA|nr:hypothetical protein ES319_D04G115300v1 [Gossypium barbadense]TYG73703.1 hypothetical protein ES288_D04G123100v1 [Gossypium darwinii]